MYHVALRKPRNRRKLKIRGDIFGTAEKPRLSVFRSLNEIYVQLVDDLKGRTLVSASSKDLKGTKTAQAFEVGKKVAEKAKEKKIKEVVFDRNGYLYHGRVKSLADGARDGGLKF
jgi:large subunit ribosomal protein L18